MIFENLIAVKIASGTSHATPGTRSTVAHGLAKSIQKERLIVQTFGVDGDTDDAGVVIPIKTSTTTITVKSNKASTKFVIWMYLPPTILPGVVTFPTV